MSESEKIAKITVIGDGGWGTAIACILARNHHPVTLWGHDARYLEEMAASRLNRLFLPNIPIDPNVTFNPDLNQALAWADLVLTVIPSKFLRPTLLARKAKIDPEKPVVSLTKGLDGEELQRPSQVVAECLGTRHILALSGPSHAEEVARNLPASVVVASDELEWARKIQHILTTPRFRVYASRDIVGVELAGAVKNIIALAAGLVHGMGLGDNALAALATRGLAEMVRLGVRLGGDAATFSGLAGMGDLITTCMSPLSRNRKVGEQLAAGMSLEEILASMNGVPESVSTTRLAVRLAEKHQVSMPITRQVAAVLWEGKSPLQALDELMNRARKDED